MKRSIQPIHRTVLTAVMVAVLGAGGFLVLQPERAEAAGGGCYEYPLPGVTSNFAFGACIGDNGVQVGGDVYVHKFSRRGGRCAVEISVHESGTGRAVTTVELCKLGRIGPVRMPMRSGYRYYTHIVIADSEGGLVGDSPYAH